MYMKLKKLLARIIKEDAVDDLKSAYEKQDLATFSRELASVLDDPKVFAVLVSGTRDGSLADDRFTITQTRLKCKNLIPTQNEIGFNQSIENLLTDQYGSLKSILTGTADMGPNPIVVYAGEFIIDGHHRWSQAYVGNPDSTILALNIEQKPGFSHIDVLKVVHAAVAKQLKAVPTNTALGTNILDGVSADEIRTEVENKLTDNARNLWMQYGGNIDSDEDIVQRITDNINLMAKKGAAAGAPSRQYMPQTDADNLKTKDTLRQLKGIVNVQEPFVAESIREKFTRIGRLRKYGNS
jgi:hypothetical protein